MSFGAFEKIPSNSNPLVGDTITFHIEIRNTSNDDMLNVAFTDQVPPTLTVGTVTSTQGTPVVVNNLVTIDIGTVSQQDSAFISIPVQVNSAGTIVNIANITFIFQGDEGSANAEATIHAGFVCIHPDMEVTLTNGRIKKIKDVMSGDVLKTNRKSPAKVVINHRNVTEHERLIKIDKDAIALNVPDKPLLLTSNHPIFIDGQYVKPRSLLNGESVTRVKSDVHTHTLVTDNGNPVLINGVEVSTWKDRDWAR